MLIAVAGGTGVVGRHVVAAAHEHGHRTVVLSRGTGADVTTGVGVAEALTGVDALIDVTNIQTLSAGPARKFFETATHHLLTAEASAGVAHHVTLSIVGIDDLDQSYYAGKLAQERILAQAQVPSTIVRAAQFHEFAGQMLTRMKGPVALMPKFLMRPVAASEVGTHLVSVAESTPAGRAPDLVGPRDEVLADLARRQLEHDGVRRKVLQVRLPGSYGAGLASGVLRGTGDAVEGDLTFDQWLSN